MALQQVFFYEYLSTEKYLVDIDKCPCSNSCTQTNLMTLPSIPNPCYECSWVAVRLKDSALIQQSCEESVQKSILARIISKTRLLDENDCPTDRYIIVVQYDDNQLVNPELGLQTCDIDSYSCFDNSSQYLQARLDCINVPETITVADTETVNMSLLAGVITSNVILAPGTDEDPNPIVETVNGLDIDCAKLATRCSSPDTGWATSNVVSTKVLNANATTTNELADVVGTLIETLIAAGILSA